MVCIKQYPLSSSEAELRLELTTGEMIDEQEKISYTTYGFRVLDQADSILFAADDVDTNREFVENFIKLCADHDVRLVHIPDLLEDYMARR